MTQNSIKIISLDVKELNSLNKRHVVTRHIRKINPTLCYLKETYKNNKSKHRVKDW